MFKSIPNTMAGTIKQNNKLLNNWIRRNYFVHAISLAI